MHLKQKRPIFILIITLFLIGCGQTADAPPDAPTEVSEISAEDESPLSTQEAEPEPTAIPTETSEPETMTTEAPEVEPIPPTPVPTRDYAGALAGDKDEESLPSLSGETAETADSGEESQPDQQAAEPTTEPTAGPTATPESTLIPIDEFVPTPTIPASAETGTELKVEEIDGEIVVTLPDGPAPTESSSSVLSEGDGPVVEMGDRAVVAYVMYGWNTSYLVETTDQFDGPIPISLGLGMVPETLENAIAGQKVGSRLLVIFEEGMDGLPFYFDQTDAYVLVVDIVGKE